MTSAVLSPPEAARGALRVGLSLPEERVALVAATAHHIQSVVAVLRELDFAETAPDFVTRPADAAEGALTDAAA